jgi:hypothetical protein
MKTGSRALDARLMASKFCSDASHKADSLSNAMLLARGALIQLEQLEARMDEIADRVAHKRYRRCARADLQP